ncbi:MAG: NACHT domain-containing protein [Rubrivivax sp.]|nr:NACHT domain-containing protein [Rubrivivax sp.]
MRLLGAVQASDGAQVLERFPSRAVAALLARLASAPERAHAREELIELLWPGVGLDVGRNRLRQALSTLKALLEAGGPAGAPVLLADRVHVRVAPAGLASDVQAFERLARAGHAAEARALYLGEFMPGYYDEWIDDARRELAALDERLAERLHRAPPGPHPGPRAEVGTPAHVAAATPAPARGVEPIPALDARAVAGLTGDPRRNLPHYLTRLIGAAAALDTLAARVRAGRLVTVTGPGGSGKTRLAVEAAHRLAAADPGPHAFDLIAFVPLAACTTQAQLLDAVIGVLQVTQGGADPLAAVVEALAGRRVLLVLDNLEQLVPAGQEPLAHWLGALPGLHVLATSRRVLALDGEVAVPADALPLPPAEAGVAEAAANPAVALFVERARAARADFHLGARNAAVLAELARALEGMPLAIELAASRVRSIAPAQMLERLREGTGTPQLDLLARSGPRSAHDARHASMQRVIEWSWDQLAAAPAALLAALTVFPGGFTGEAAQVVAEGLFDGERENRPQAIGAPVARASRPDATLLLDELVAHSLLVARPAADGGDLRFAIYQPIREFATARLPAGDLARHRASLRRWARRWVEALPRTPPLVLLREEMPNLVAAMAGAVHDGAPHEAVELLLALRRCLEDVELPAEGLALARAAVERVADPVQAARGHSLVAPLLFTAGRSEAALAHAERGVDCEALDMRQRARALHALARVCWRSRHGVERVEPLLDEATALLGGTGGEWGASAGGVAVGATGGRAGGAAEPADAAVANTADPDTELRASLLALRAFVINRLHRRFAEGEQLHAQALALWERTGNQHAIDSGRYNLAVCAQNANRHAQTLEQLAPVIASARALGDWRRLSQCLNVRGNALTGLRRWTEANEDYRECIRVAWRSMSNYDLAFGLWNLPRALLRLRRPELGVRLLAHADLHWRTHFGALHDQDRRYLVRIRRLAERQLPPAQVRSLWREGAALTLAEAVSLALA